MSLMLQLYPSELNNTYNKIYDSKVRGFSTYELNRKYLLDDKINYKLYNKESISEDDMYVLLNKLKIQHKVNMSYSINELAKDCKIYYKKENYTNYNTNYNNYRSKERAGVVISKTIDGVKKYLIVKGNLGEGKWSFPKGHLDHPNELLEIGASRELYEETGVFIEPEFISKLPKKKISRCTYFYLDDDTYKLNISNDLTIYKTHDSYEVETKEWKSLEEIKFLLINYDMKKYFGLNK